MEQNLARGTAWKEALEKPKGGQNDRVSHSGSRELRARGGGDIGGTIQVRGPGAARRREAVCQAQQVPWGGYLDGSLTQACQALPGSLKELVWQKSGSRCHKLAGDG